MVKEFRKEYEDAWPTPPVMDCWNYIVQEIAEVGDWLMRNGYGQRNDYFRMHSRFGDTKALVEELGDVLVMVCTLATLLDIDVEDAAIAALDEKEQEIVKGKNK
jgi:NTP pyrophosphatase (non-canonical NTP hydrolase)